MGGRAALALVRLLVSAACSREERVKDGVATDEGIAAIASPEDHYRELLKRSFLATQSGPIMLGVLGLDDGCHALDSAVDAVVKRNLPQWRANLIAAYRNNVPAAQLAEAVQKSPRRARSTLQPHVAAIGNSMKQMSLPLLENSNIEVLGSTFAASSRVDKSSRNMAARQKDLARIRAADEICGVRRWPQQ